MNDWEQRQAERAERFRDRASDARSRSRQGFDGARKIADMIPMGQPILVGHHSEGRHRRDLDRIDRGMRQGVQEADKADYYEDRASSIESDRSISQYDPDAIKKMEERIAGLESDRDSLKRVNKAFRSGNLDGLSDREANAVTKLRAAGPDFAGRLGVPGYVLTNLGAEIRRLKQRLEQLRKTAGRSWSMLERKDVAVGAYYRDEYPPLREAVLALVGEAPSWADRKWEWRQFRDYVLKRLTDDDMDRLTRRDAVPETTGRSDG